MLTFIYYEVEIGFHVIHKWWQNFHCIYTFKAHYFKTAERTSFHNFEFITPNHNWSELNLKTFLFKATPQYVLFLKGVKTKKIFFIKVKTLPRLPETAHLNTPPHVYVTVWEDLQNTAQMYTQRKKAELLFSL